MMDQKSQSDTESPGAAFKRQSRALDKTLLSDMMPTYLIPAWGFWWAEDVGCWVGVLLHSSPSLPSELLELWRDWPPSSPAGRSQGREGAASRLKPSCLGWLPLNSTFGKNGLSREEERSLPNQGRCLALPCTRTWGHQKAASSTPVKGIHSPATAELWPPCCGSMENDLKIYRQKNNWIDSAEKLEEVKPSGPTSCCGGASVPKPQWL